MFNCPVLGKYGYTIITCILYIIVTDVSSKKFDLMLMLRLLDTFTNLTISKIISFATGVSGDLSMILDFRTKVVNNINGTLGESDFYSLWNDLSQVGFKIQKIIFSVLLRHYYINLSDKVKIVFNCIKKGTYNVGIKYMVVLIHIQPKYDKYKCFFYL